MDELVSSYRARIHSALAIEPAIHGQAEQKIEIYHQRIIFDKIQAERMNLWLLAEQDIAKFQVILRQSVEQITELILFKRKQKDNQNG